MQYVVWQSNGVTEQFIIGSIAQFIERRTSVNPASSIRGVGRGLSLRWCAGDQCLGKTVPCADGVRQTCCRAALLSPWPRYTRSAVRSRSRVAQHAQWQTSRLQWPRPASSGCHSARFLAVVPVQQHAVASSCCLRTTCHSLTWDYSAWPSSVHWQAQYDERLHWRLV